MKVLLIVTTLVVALFTSVHLYSGRELLQLIYPENIQHRLLEPQKVSPESEDSFKKLKFKIGTEVRVQGDAVFVDLYVTNDTSKDIVVICSGRQLQQGGVTPFSLNLTKAARKKILYVGPPIPPGPPPPVQVIFPAHSRTKFTQNFSLKDYHYAGEPTAEYEWRFNLWHGKSPEGKFRVALPERESIKNPAGTPK